MRPICHLPEYTTKSGSSLPTPKPRPRPVRRMVSTASHAGFFILIQSGERPLRYVESLRLLTMPSRAELAGHAERRSHCRHSMVLVEPDEPMRRAANVWTIKLGIAAPNLYAREIWVPVLRNLDTADIG